MDIRVSQLKKSYGPAHNRTPVLKDLSFTLDSGDFVAIMGTSGSGKTTLLNIMGGLDRGFEGQVHVGPHALDRMSERALAQLRNQRFGFVFQQFHLLDHLSALENVSLPDFFTHGAPREPQQVTARAASLLARVGLGDKLESRPTALSGGQKQRVAIARALLNSPAILFCDEPTGSLDRQTGLQILDLFEELNAQDGLTLIMVTHEEHIASRARRVLRLEDGALVSDEASQDTASQAASRAASHAAPDQQEVSAS